jgi:hypothetical protein
MKSSNFGLALAGGLLDALAPKPPADNDLMAALTNFMEAGQRGEAAKLAPELPGRANTVRAEYDRHVAAKERERDAAQELLRTIVAVAMHAMPAIKNRILTSYLAGLGSTPPTEHFTSWRGVMLVDRFTIDHDRYEGAQLALREDGKLCELRRVGTGFPMVRWQTAELGIELEDAAEKYPVELAVVSLSKLLDSHTGRREASTAAAEARATRLSAMTAAFAALLKEAPAPKRAKAR